MMTISTLSVERVANGWIIAMPSGIREIYVDENEMLLAIHRNIGYWKTGDIVSIKKKAYDEPTETEAMNGAASTDKN